MPATYESVLATVKKMTREQIAQTAIEQNAKVMATDPRPLTMVRHVDGVEGAPETAVKDGGVIVYDYGRLDVVAEFALDTLRQLSPVDSGDYVRSHVIMINGVVVDNADNPNSRSLSSWREGDRITISNLAPYTRKIEAGRQGYRRHGHVYEKAAAMVNRRYGNLAHVTFTFEKAPRGGGSWGINAWAAQTGMSHKGHASDRSRLRWLLNQPTLVITAV